MKQKSRIFLMLTGLTFLITAFILGTYFSSNSILYAFHIILYALAAIFMGMAIGYAVGFDIGYSMGIKESAKSSKN